MILQYIYQHQGNILSEFVAAVFISEKRRWYRGVPSSDHLTRTFSCTLFNTDIFTLITVSARIRLSGGERLHQSPEATATSGETGFQEHINYLSACGRNGCLWKMLNCASACWCQVYRSTVTHLSRLREKVSLGGWIRFFLFCEIVISNVVLVSQSPPLAEKRILTAQSALRVGDIAVTSTSALVMVANL